MERRRANEGEYRDGITITKAPIQISGLRWPVAIYDQHMQIGCEFHAHADWADFNDQRIASMDGRDALRFWRAHKTELMALCNAHAPTEIETEAASCQQ
jgi:hypothetical protein